MLTEPKHNHEKPADQVEKRSTPELPDDALQLIFRFLPSIILQDMFSLGGDYDGTYEIRRPNGRYTAITVYRMAERSSFNIYAQVNKQWNRVAMDRPFWRARFQQDYPQFQYAWLRRQRGLYSRVVCSKTPTDPGFNWAKAYARAWRHEMRQYKNNCLFKSDNGSFGRYCKWITWPEYIKRDAFEAYLRYESYKPYPDPERYGGGNSLIKDIFEDIGDFSPRLPLIDLICRHKHQRFLNHYWQHVLKYYLDQRARREREPWGIESLISFKELMTFLCPQHYGQSWLELLGDLEISQGDREHKHRRLLNFATFAIMTNQKKIVQQLIARCQHRQTLDQTFYSDTFFRQDGEEVKLSLNALAAACGHTHLVSLCLKAGADVNARALRIYRRRNIEKPYHTALHYAVVHGHLDTVQYLLQQPTIEPNISTVGGDTALHFAAYSGRLDIVQCLLNADVAVDYRNDEGLLAFDIAINNQSIEIAREIFSRMSLMFLFGLSPDDPLCHRAISTKARDGILAQSFEYLLAETPDEYYTSLQFLLPLKDYWETYRKTHYSIRKHPPEDKAWALFFLISATSRADLAVRRDFLQTRRPDLLASRFSGSLHHAVTQAMGDLPLPIAADKGLVIEVVGEEEKQPLLQTQSSSALEHHERHQQPSLADLLADSDDEDEERRITEGPSIISAVPEPPVNKQALFNAHLERAQSYYYRNKDTCFGFLSTHGKKGQQGVIHYQTAIREAYDNPELSQQAFMAFLTQETLAFLQGLESQTQQDGQPYRYAATTFSKSMSRFTDFKDLMIDGLPYQARLKELFSCKRFVNGPWGKFFRGLFLFLSVLALTAVIVSFTCGTGSIPIVCVVLQYADMLSKAFGLAVSCALAVSPNALSLIGYFAGNSTKPKFKVIEQKDEPAVGATISQAAA